MKLFAFLNFIAGLFIGWFVFTLDLPFLPSFGIMIFLSAVSALLFTLLLVDNAKV